MVLHCVPWSSYVAVRELLDSSGLQMTYIEGELELMSPSLHHELWKTNIGRLIEHYAYLRRIKLTGYGSVTLQHEAAKRAAEPDECYVVDRKLQEGDYPDLAIEVIHKAPLLDKLDVYQAMRVDEVWVFRDGTFTVYGLTDQGYTARPHNTFLPDLDLAVIAALAVTDDLDDALRELDRRYR